MKSYSTGLVVLSLVAVFWASSDAEGIPAFARKYRTSCSTCHVVVPKLNDFGEAFRLNGFKIPGGDELFIREKPVSLGAEALRDDWPDTFLPASIPGNPPLAVWVKWGFSQLEGDEEKANFGEPTVVWLIGANLGESVSFFAEVGGDKRRAYVKFDDILNNPLMGDWVPARLLDLRVGLVEPELIAFSDARRVPLTSHAMYNAGYKYPNGNGNPLDFDRQVAAELMGIAGDRVRYVVGVTHGTNDSADNNREKDIYYRAAWKVLGGLPFSGSDELEDSLPSTGNWIDNSLTVGFFGYHGFSSIPDATSPGSEYDLDFYRFGVDLRGNWDNLDVSFALSWGEDENAANDGMDLGVVSGMLEADYMVLQWVMLYAKYEWLDFRGPNSSSLDDQEVSRFSGGVTAQVYANIRLTAEYVESSDLHRIDRPDGLLFRLDLDF